MSVLVYIEVSKGRVKKSSLECVNYAAHIAKQLNTSVTAVVNNADDAHVAELGKAGANKVLKVKNDKIGNDSVLITAMVEQAAKAEGSKVVIFAFDVVGKACAPRLSAKLK